MRETLEIAMQTVRGLKSLHVEHKLVHQDLKPGNILRFGDVRVAGVTSGLFKLGDFGLCARAAAGEQEDDAEADDEKATATATADALSLQGSGGTYAYMAPLQAWSFGRQRAGAVLSESEKRPQATSDVWAAGLILLQLVGRLDKAVSAAVGDYLHTTSRALRQAFASAKAGHATEASRAAVADMAERAEKLVAASEAACARELRDEALRSAWLQVNMVARQCLAGWSVRRGAGAAELVEIKREGAQGACDAQALESGLQAAWRALMQQPAFPDMAAAGAGSRQFLDAQKLFAAYTPRERAARYHGLVLGERVRACELLQDQLAVELKVPESAGRDVAGLCRTLLGRLENKKTQPAHVRLCALVVDLAIAWDVAHGAAARGELEAARAAVAAVSLKLEAMWGAAGLRGGWEAKKAFGRRLGTTADSMSPVCRLSEAGASGVMSAVWALADAKRRVSWLTKGGDETEWTALHRACAGGHVEAVELLMRACQDMDAAQRLQVLITGDDRQFTALHLACENGHSGAVELLLRGCEGMSAAQRLEVLTKGNDRQFTALHLACQNGHSGAVELLLGACEGMGAAQRLEVLTKGNDGQFTALHWACHEGHSGAVELLLGACRSLDTVQQRMRVRDARTQYGETAVEIARRNEHAELAARLESGFAALCVPASAAAAVARTHVPSGQDVFE